MFRINNPKSCLGKANGAERSFLVRVCRAQVSGEDLFSLLHIRNDLISDLEAIALKHPQWDFLRAVILRLHNTPLSDITPIVQKSREFMLNSTDYLYQTDKGTTKRCLFERNGLYRFCNSCPVGRFARERFLEIQNPDNPNPLEGNLFKDVVGGWGSK